MAGLLVPGPSSECVHCRVFDLEFGQADRLGSALQLPDRLWRDGSRSGATGWAAFLTVQRAFFRGLGANSRQSSPML